MTAPELPIAAAQAGDARALEAVLRAVAPTVSRFGRRLCGASPDADDALQETLLQIAQHLPDFEGRSSFSSWVYAITRSACARRRRGLKNRPPVPDERAMLVADDAPSPESASEARELREALGHALAALSDDHREAIELRDVEGLPVAEVATALGITVEATKSRLHRARAALKDALEAQLKPRGKPAPTSACPDIAALWSAKLEGDLAQVDCAAMEQHVAGCPGCNAACFALKDALSVCQAVREEEVPADVQAQVKAAVAAWTASR